MKGKKLNTERGRVVFGENRGKTFRGVGLDIKILNNEKIMVDPYGSTQTPILLMS